MSEQELKLLLGGGAAGQLEMFARMGNRHGMIAGATGSGKTVSLQILAEAYSRIGVPVFLSDVKGDLSGLASEGKPHPKITSRLESIGIDDYKQRPYPTVFWDVFGEKGHPLRTTISEMGPLLISNLFELNATQEGVMYAAFRIADDNGMLLLDIKDLRSMLSWMADNAKELRSDYGNISTASVAAIQRRLLVLEEQGGEHFFGEPAMTLTDIMQSDFSGNGVINILNATRLINTAPRLYATFLLWLLSELFEQLPEVGDPERPKLVFFFDEAHLLFKRAPRPLLDKIEQVVRLVRSKGVGIYFISQSPMDIPDEILGQLGLKIQHVLRAFTERDRKAIRAVAQNFRTNPALDSEAVISELGTGEALVSTLDLKGRPTQVEQVLIRPPESRLGPLTDTERNERIQRSPLRGKYEQAVDRESAYEILARRAEKEVAEEKAQEAEEREAEEREAVERKTAKAKPKSSSRRQGVGEALMKSAARAIGGQVGRRIIRGILGSLLGGR